MTRPTSLASYRALPLPEAQASALAALTEHGPCTAQELERASGLRHVNKRTSELRDAGQAHEVGRRPCAVSGRAAIVWAAGEGTGVRRAPVTPTGKLCGDCAPVSTLHDVGDACGACGRYVVSVAVGESVGGIACRVVTTWPAVAT